MSNGVFIEDMTGWELLPRNEWRIKFVPEPPCVLVSAHVKDLRDNRSPGRTWLKFQLDDLPNDFVSKDDLERIGVDWAHVGAVG